MREQERPRSIYLSGATASGKSAVAAILAEVLDGEIVSVDSMQVYRGLDIGTAKPSQAERTKIRHHLIDVVELSESFDVGQFLTLAGNARREIHERGKVAVFSGGTGFYFKAWIEGIGGAPPSDRGLRARLEEMELKELLNELELKDPETFETIDRKNKRRVVRALEVIQLTGKGCREHRARWTTQKAPGPSEEPGLGAGPKVFGLVRSSDDLRRRIDVRVDQMFKSGLVAETERLLPIGLAANRTAGQAIGYRQVHEYLRGERSLKETVELIKIRTRQYAKRQMTWLRYQLPVEWIEVGAAESAESVARRLLARLQAA